MNKRPMRDLDVRGKRVLLRTDYNVDVTDGCILDDQRMVASLPTVGTLLASGARVVIATHRGRPRGRANLELRVGVLAPRLSELLGIEVKTAGDCIGPEAQAAVDRLAPGDVLLLENLRFHPEEEANDAEFAAALARLGDCYVDDAFGAIHRAHASIVGVPQYLPSAAGLLVEREVDALEGALRPPRPAGLVLGGVKFEDKLPLIEHLLPEMDVLCLGGMVGMAMLRALGLDMENVEVAQESVERARRIVREIRARPGFRLVLPHAVVATDGVQTHAMSPTQVPAGWRVVDTAAATVDSFERALGGTRSVIWNGPLGEFERPPCDSGTNELVEFLANHSGITIAAGGSTTAAIRRCGFAGEFTHLSTGGGAALHLLSGEPLPGLDALPDAD